MSLLPQARTWSAIGTGSSRLAPGLGSIAAAHMPQAHLFPSGPVKMAPVAPVKMNAGFPQQNPQLRALAMHGGTSLIMGNPKVMSAVSVSLTPAERNRALMLVNQKEANLERLIIDRSIISMYTKEQKEAIAKDIVISSSELAGIGTINDSRMGVVGMNMQCGYCGQIDCPSHYGLLTLPYPMYNPIGIRTIISVLQVVCNCCGRLLLSREVMERQGMLRLTGDRRLFALEAYCKDGSHSCLKEKIEGVPDCRPNPSYEVSKEGIKTGLIRKIIVEDKNNAQGRKDGTKVTCNIYEIISILQNISPEDAKLMGFSQTDVGILENWGMAVSHPLNLIMFKLLMPTPIIRPHVYMGGTFRNDTLTTAYVSLIKAVLQLIATSKKIDSRDKKALAECPNLFMSDAEIHSGVDAVEAMRNIYRILSGIFNDSSKAKVGHGSNQMISIQKRFDGKKGIGRMNAQGKRVNYSGRSVLGPASDLADDEIGIPTEFASILTVPVKVNRYNMEYLTGLLVTGKIQYIRQANTGLRRRYDREQMKTDYTLKIGDIVERWLQDGDYTMFNRQPTLHKQSMLAARVRLGPFKTIRIPLPLCKALNADFDGDEGNLWPPQFVEAMVECRYIYNMVLNLMSSENNSPMMGLTMNAVTSSFLLTANDVRIPEPLFRILIDRISDKTSLQTLSSRLRQYGVHPRSGEAIISALFPADFYYHSGSVRIVDGIINAGQLKSGNVSTAARSIVQDLHKQYGPERTSKFITEATWVTCKWMIERGFTVGLADIINPEESKDGRLVVGNAAVVKSSLATIYLEVDAAGPPQKDPVEEAYRLKRRSNILNSAQAVGLLVAEKCFKIKGNNIGSMSDYGSGAKGGLANIGQMMGFASQQYYLGEPLKPSISGNRRLIPDYDLDDYSPEANAFIPRSYYEGLTPEQLFFLMVGSRQGILDSTLNTPKTGSMHHLLGKGSENEVVGHDGSVRNTSGTMFSPSYGSGFDISEMMNVHYQNRKNISNWMDVTQLTERLNVKAGWIPAEVDDMIKARQAAGTDGSDFMETFLPQPTIAQVVAPKVYPAVVYQAQAPAIPLKLSRYEISNILCSRANQLANDAVLRVPMTNLSPEALSDVVGLAKMELDAGMLMDLSSVRKYPNGRFMEAISFNGVSAVRV
jgi:DNA-directed RNA polymerase II subunit RPB1